MDIQKYIESGILECYALGECSVQETAEVEALAGIYPEIQEELDEIQEGLEFFAQMQSKTPPTALKAQLLAAIDEVDDLEEDDSEENDTKKDKDKPQSPLTWGQFFLYLVVGGLAIWSLYRNVQTQNVQKGLKNQMSVMQDSIKNQQKSMAAALDECKQMLEQITAPRNNRILMAGTDNYPEQQALIFWNPETAKTQLLNVNLPKLAADQSYQLWAIVGGKPVDLGVLDNQAINDLLAMKSVEAPEAFAITIEPKGGSENPTMEKMVVLGKVS